MRKLLIADDEEGVRRLVRVTLEEDGLEILEAGDGEEALSLVREHQPQVLLLDVMMPKMTGFEVCRAIKTDARMSDTVVVMLSAKTQQADLEEAAEAGADHYFTKPFSPVALLNKIDEIFDDRNSEDGG